MTTQNDIRAIQHQIRYLDEKLDKLIKMVKDIQSTVNHIQAYQK